jgi:hypothetical protein
VFEHHKSALVSRRVFLTRLGKHVGIGLCLIAVSLTIGVLGYHYIEDMPWIDAFANASMILSGMGPLGPTLQTTAGKLFASFYALYSGLALITIVGIMLAPAVHRLFHKFHLESHLADKGGESHTRKNR